MCVLCCLIVASQANSINRLKRSDSEGTYNCADRNPCTQENIDAGNFYFANDDPKKFVQCSEFLECFVRPCAPGTEWSQAEQTCVHEGTTEPPVYETFNCEDRNPCTEENAAAGNFYFANDDPLKFVQCSEHGQCFIMPCGPGTKWSQAALTCVHDGDSGDGDGDIGGDGDDGGDGDIGGPSDDDTYDCGDNNPCTQENIDAGRFYFPHHVVTNFVQCSAHGQCWVMPCAPGTEWNQELQTCDWPKDEPDYETYNCDDRNPCTVENANAGKFYFANDAPEKFVQCSAHQQCWVMPCGPGTVWDQSKLTCDWPNKR